LNSLAYINSAIPHLTCRLVNWESSAISSRVVYITRFGGLLPGRFCWSAPTWSGRTHLPLPGKRWLRPSGGCRLIAEARAVERDKRKLIDIWRVSGLTTLSWKILMTIHKNVLKYLFTLKYLFILKLYLFVLKYLFVSFLFLLCIDA